MSILKEHIKVDVRYQRATRIDQDLDAKGEFFKGFVFHGTAEYTLKNIADNYSQTGRKAFTVTGPYGSGKSTIALLLAGLLSTKKTVRDIAHQVVGDEFFDKFHSNVAVTNGWFTIKSVCDFQNPISALWDAITVSASENDIDISRIEVPTDSKTFIKAFKNLSLLIVGRFDGILILFDEMGKSLDFLNSKGLDLQFYQELAECVDRLDTQALFVGFLHQAFAEYAQGKPQAVRDSWAKVQGRFTDLLFNVSEDETVTLLGNSIKHQASYEPKAELVGRTLDALCNTSISKISNINEKLASCIPLHPLTALILGPISKRRFSQNERSIFSFLSTSESFGFQWFIQENNTDNLYRLCDLYDYLDTNLEHLILASPDSKAWLEAKDAVERTEAKKSGFVVDLIKTIAILNLFGRKLNLYASKEVLHLALEESLADESIDESLEQLKKDQVIIYRRHLQSYAVFEGSDLDLDEELDKFRSKQLDSEDWKSYLEKRAEHIVAKRHYHEKGVLRWMKLIVETDRFDAKSFAKKHKFNAIEFSAFVLLTSDDPITLSKKYPDYVFGSSEIVMDQLRSQIVELIGLEYISKQNAMIQHDRIARREVESRLALMSLSIDKLYLKLFDDASWFKNGEHIHEKVLSKVASQFAAEYFEHAPILFNELINRAKPSGTAVSARKKLMVKMVEDYFEPNLAITGYPPEMAMYKSCLESFGLHSSIDGNEHTFVFPDESKFPELHGLWRSTITYVQKNQDRIVNLKEIADIWNAKPYGLTQGVIPIWSLALIMSQLDTLAFYDKDVTNKFIYITEPDEEFVNKLIRQPDQVGIRYFAVDGVKQSQINSLQRVMSETSNTTTTLKVAQSFVSFVSRLTPYVKNTKELSAEAKKFRELALKANDPNKFLLEDLPEQFSNAQGEELVDVIRRIIDELKTKHKKTLEEFSKDIDRIVGKRDQQLFDNAIAVEGYSADSSLKTFALRISEFGSVDSDVWVSNIISFLSGKAERNWNDLAVEKARSELVKFAQKFKQATYFAIEMGQSDKSLEEKDHSNETQKIDELLEEFSVQEQVIILKKKLEILLG